MTEYSGKTMVLAHKHGEDTWKKSKGAGSDCIKQVTVLDVQWSNFPIEVMEDIKSMWGDYGLGNDTCYQHVCVDEELLAEYPLLHEYLTGRNITECLVHYWW